MNQIRDPPFAPGTTLLSVSRPFDLRRVVRFAPLLLVALAVDAALAADVDLVVFEDVPTE